MAMRVFVLFLMTLMSAKAQGASANLLEALSYVPTSQTLVEFMDMELIKHYENAETISSQSPLEARASFMNTLSQKHVVSLGDIASRWQQHADFWGFDPTDIRWSLITSDLVVYVIAFREDFDFTTLKNLLEERGFAKTSYEDATLYQHGRDLSAEWLLGNLSILNTAILEDEKVLIMSSIPESVEAILKTRAGQRKSLASEASIQTITEQLGETAGVILEINNCLAYSMPVRLTETFDKLKEKFEELASSSLHPYQILALGYRYERDKPLGTLLLHYANISNAQSDLEVRKQGAAEGTSLVVKKTYKESVFELESAVAQGNTIIFNLRPVDDKPQRLFSMVYQRDVAFAGCP